MSGLDLGFSIRAIVVPVEASLDNLAVLEAAAELAARLQAEIKGLFVEDVNLLRLAASPLARAMQLHSGARESADAEALERALRVQAQRARDLVARAAERLQVPWSFQVSRAALVQAVWEAAAGSELLAMERTMWSLLRTGARGAVTAAAETTTRAALLLKARVPRGEPVLVLYDGSEAAAAALAAGAALARALGSPLTVLVLDDGSQGRAEREELEGRLRAFAREGSLRVTPYALAAASPEAIVRAVKRFGQGILVVSAASPRPGGAAVERLLAELANPLLIVP